MSDQAWIKRINFYCWIPTDTKNYGQFGITATEFACQELIKSFQLVADGEIPSRTYELPGVSQADVDEIGGGLSTVAVKVSIRKQKDVGRRLAMEWDSTNRVVEFLVCAENLIDLRFVFEDIAQGSGDMCYGLSYQGKEAFLFYWACFGHIQKTAEPTHRFPES